MASAQQKPKQKKGERNSNRRNGKAFQKRSPAFLEAIGYTATKFTGRSIMGYKRERVIAWAKANNLTLDEQIAKMKEERREKMLLRKITNAEKQRAKRERETPKKLNLWMPEKGAK